LKTMIVRGLLCNGTAQFFYFPSYPSLHLCLFALNYILLDETLNSFSLIYRRVFGPEAFRSSIIGDDFNQPASWLLRICLKIFQAAVA
jgi:hypothetical protein